MPSLECNVGMYYKESLSFWNKRRPVVWIRTILGIKECSFGSGQEEGGEVNLGQKFIVQLWFYDLYEILAMQTGLA